MKNSLFVGLFLMSMSSFAGGGGPITIQWGCHLDADDTCTTCALGLGISCDSVPVCSIDPVTFCTCSCVGQSGGSGGN